MITAQSIYNRSPVPLQTLLVSLSGAVKARQRYGKKYHEHRSWLVDFDTWGLERMLEHQAHELQKFVAFSANRSAFYQAFYQGIDHKLVRAPSDLEMLPVLEKDLLRSNMADVYTVGRRRSVEGHTGGTTGKSLVVRYTIEDQMRRMAMLDHFKSRHGFENIKMRRATFSGKHIASPDQQARVYWRHNRAANQMLYSTFDINERNLRYYVQHLNEYKPAALDGFVTSLTDLASFIERNNMQLTFRPVAIFTTSETVTHRARELLERVFSTRVYDQYASSEGAPFITECSENSLHIELSSGVFENFSDSHEILVTSFHTHGTPLIRYRIGDSISLNRDGRCSCGLSSPLAASIQGRSDDFLIRGDGAKVN